MIKMGYSHAEKLMMWFIVITVMFWVIWFLMQLMINTINMRT